MADRRVTVLNPGGYQEVLQTADRLFVDSLSQFAQTAFTANISGVTADFSGQITLGADPTLETHAVTLGYLETVAAGLTLTAAAPIQINDQEISILAATETALGAVRFATDAEVIAGTAVDAAVKPDQIGYALDDITIAGSAPITVTESPANTFDIDINYATDTTDGSVRFATDAEAALGLKTDVAITPAQITASIAAIPYATRSTPGIVRLATPQEAVDGVADNVAVTPDQLDAKVDEVDVTADLPLVVDADALAKDFHFSINNASQTLVGVLRFATNAEVTDGTSTDTAITPAQLDARLGGFVITDATTTNKGIVMLARDSDVAGGTESTKAVTASGMRYALDQPDYLLDAGTY